MERLARSPDVFMAFAKNSPIRIFPNMFKEARGPLLFFERRKSFPVKPPFACGGCTLAPRCAITALHLPQGFNVVPGEIGEYDALLPGGREIR